MRTIRRSASPLDHLSEAARAFLAQRTREATGLGLIESVREPRDDVELTVWGETKMFTINVGRDTPVRIARG